MAVMSAIASAVLMLGPVSAPSPEGAPASSHVTSLAVGAGAQSTTATICYWLPRLPGCPIKKG